MALHPVYAQVTALLIAVFILITGNGLFQTLVPLRATIEGFSVFELGLLGSMYFAGMFVGCIAAPRIVAHAGHIRAFAALVAGATVTALAHPLIVDPWAWNGFRMVTGFCFAGLYATMESWLHDKADNVVRGRLLALYQIVHYAGSAIGQQAIRLAEATSFALFSLVAAALSLSVLPLAFTRTDPPHPPPVPRLRLAWLYRISPVGVVGALAAGAANGTFWALAPVFATRAGLSAAGVASFMTAVIVGAAASQWPVGRLADRRDRRVILCFAMLAAIAVEIALVVLAGTNLVVLLALALALGASMFLIYPLASSHAADLAGRANAVETSSALLLTYTMGAIIGPSVAAAMMARISPEALFIHNAAIHAALVLFVLWRLRKRPLRADPNV